MKEVKANIWSETLKCHWVSWSVFDKNGIKLMLIENNCCDMRGAIKIAELIMPEVLIIETYSGELPDIRYEKVGDDKWEAFCKRGFRDKT